MPKDDDDATAIVAPNLRAFLGLVSIAFGEVVSRKATDAEWFGYRNEWYGGEPERLAEMERLSEALCTIPGVTRPKSPASVANAYPDQAFRLAFEDEEENEADRPKDRPWNAHTADRLARRALAEGRYEDALQHAAYAREAPDRLPRALFVSALAEWHLGYKNGAQATARELLEAWLDPKQAAPPFAHPRKLVDADELCALVRLVEGAQAGPLLARIDAAPDVEDPEGDFF